MKEAGFDSLIDLLNGLDALQRKEQTLQHDLDVAVNKISSSGLTQDVKGADLANQMLQSQVNQQFLKVSQ